MSDAMGLASMIQYGTDLRVQPKKAEPDLLAMAAEAARLAGMSYGNFTAYVENVLYPGADDALERMLLRREAPMGEDKWHVLDKLEQGREADRAEKRRRAQIAAEEAEARGERMSRCLACGIVLPKLSQKYCGPECRREYKRQLLRQALRQAKRKCEWCGDLIPEGKMITARYCCDGCRNAASQARSRQREAERRMHPDTAPGVRVQAPVCARCGRPMPIGIHANAKYCGLSCAESARMDYNREYRRNRKH